MTALIQRPDLAFTVGGLLMLVGAVLLALVVRRARRVVSPPVAVEPVTVLLPRMSDRLDATTVMPRVRGGGWQ